MREEYLPFTDEERAFRVEGARQSVGMPGSAGMLRWDATLRAVEAERDAYRRVVGVYQDKWPTPREKAADIRWWTKVLEFDPAHKEEEARAWEMLADVVEEAATP